MGKNNSPKKYAVIKKYYNQEDELSEAVSVFIEDQIESDGTEFFLTTEYFDNEDLTILASLIKESIKNGTEKINERIRNGEFDAQPRNAEYGMREDSSLRQHNESGLYGRTMGELPSGSEGTAEELQRQRLAAAEQKVANAKGVAELADAIAERERIKNEGVSFSRDGVRQAELEAIAKEEAAIIEKAKKNGTYLKSPNGKPTKLSPKQWVQVRTKAFKKWS